MTLIKQLPRPLRVAFVDQSGDVIGGAERSLQLLLENLPPTVNATAVLFSDGAYAGDLRARGIRVVVIPMANSLLSAKREGFSLFIIPQAAFAVYRLWRAFAWMQPDVVYTNTVKAHFLAGIAARLSGRKSIAHIRDILVGFAARSLAVSIEATSCERIAISAAVASTYRLRKTTIVPNPLDLDAYRVVPSRTEARKALHLPDDAPIVGIVGRINRWKGQDQFLRVAQIVAADSNAHFAIIGAPIFRDADFEKELHSLVLRLGLKDRVHFVPWLDDPRTAYAALDVHCNTSVREPFGRTIIEAAAMGVPTVSFNDGGAIDATSPALSSDLVEPADIGAFAKAILSYLHDEERLTHAGVLARDHSATFDVSLHVRKICRILERYPARL